MLSLFRSSSNVIRALAGQAHGADGYRVETGVFGNIKNAQYDEIFKSSDRKSDKDVLDSVLAQLS